MISHTGAIVGRRRTPYIYFIRKLDYLYIGQTQDIPVIRWCDHMGGMGSFSVNLRKADEQAFHSPASINFAAYQCDLIRDVVPSIQHQPVTQFVEHMVHVNVISHSSVGTRWILISDTVRTAVAICKYDWAETMAAAIVDCFAAEAATW